MYRSVFFWLALATADLHHNTDLNPVLLTNKRLKRSADYCSMTCKGKMHTMCMYKAGVPGEECKGGWVDMDLDYHGKVKLLHLHNEYRSSVASGGHPPHPAATNVIQLVWDKELSQIAKRWVDQCHFGHDACRISERFSVGQNMAIMGETTAESGRDPDLSAEVSGKLGNMLQMWFDEIEHCPLDQVQTFTGKSPGGAIGHYTQMMWASTRRVGCAVSVWKTYPGSGYKKLNYMLGCNYGPAGNVLTAPMYATSEGCPPGTTPSREYTALCTTGEESDFSRAASIDVSVILLLTPTLLTAFMAAK